ncbi:hypothetical protein YC2023_024593 [Brassica napus]
MFRKRNSVLVSLHFLRRKVAARFSIFSRTVAFAESLTIGAVIAAIQKRFLIDFGLNLVKGCLRTPFEDQAERSSIDRAGQEIELPGRLSLTLAKSNNYTMVYSCKVNDTKKKNRVFYSCMYIYYGIRARYDGLILHGERH